jgi:flavin-dependent dehydrogenase
MTVSAQIAEHYDVIIMGGGPAGSTLGAQLARTTELSVAIFASVKSPQAHLGGPPARPASATPSQNTTPQRTGALQKVMGAGFPVPRFDKHRFDRHRFDGHRFYGHRLSGIFGGDGRAQDAGFFDHAAWEEDGAYRFGSDGNRDELDELLLRHAQELGVHVFEETAASAFIPVADGCEVTLPDGRKVHGRMFVDASGRRNGIASARRSRRQPARILRYCRQLIVRSTDSASGGLRTG